MRRAAGQVLRTARRTFPRSTRLGRGNSVHSTNDGLNTRTLTTRRDRAFQNHLITSSMYFRNFSVALLSTLVASGAYFAYRGAPGNTTEASFPLSNNPSAAAAQQARAFTTSSGYTPAASPQIDGSSSGELSQSPRKALVVEQGQLWTATIPADEPLSKSTDDYGRKILEMLTPEQATQRLRRNQESYLVGRGKGVIRYDVVQLASNDPIEDDHAEKIIEVKDSRQHAEGQTSNDWMFWGVFDGHSGWTTSAKLRQALISYVARELNTTYSSVQNSAPSHIPSPSSIDAAIKRGFVALDTSIVHDSVAQVLKAQSKPQAASLLAPALSGSCALLSFYDSASKTLRVACTGDSRAVLGRRSATDSLKWTALPLSVDQTGGNEAEAARLRKEHPNEPDVTRNGRVLGGLEPSRAFGDATYKWTFEVQDRIKREFFGKTPDRRIKTPPYVTAEPVVTTTKVQPEQGDFLVMATDGLWEMLTNEEVVGLVGQWLEKHPEVHRSSGLQSAQPSINAPGTQSDSWLQSWFSQKKAADLPVQHGQDTPDQSGQRAPIRQQQWGLEPTTSPTNGTPSSSRFVVEDKNVATHLIRNALGGGNREMVCALLTLPSPYSRRYRDDLTVEVIFFGEGTDQRADSSNGGISINTEATANATEPAKAKL